MDPTLVSSKGSRTLVETLDAYARTQPDKVFNSIPVSSDLTRGFRDVTYRDISQAVDAFATWLVSSHGESTSFETLAFLGINDLRYAIVFYASIKAGYKAFFISPLNSPSQIQKLLHKTSCRKFFFSPEHLDKIEQVLAIMPDLSIEAVEPLPYWIAAYTKPFHHNKSFDSAKWDPVIVLHSSGSTGDPKPITLNNGYFATVDAKYSPVPGREVGSTHLFDFEQGGNTFCPVPMFHLSGFLCTCVYPMFAFTATNVLGPPEAPQTPSLVKQILEMTNVKLLYTGPALVENIAKLDGGMETLNKLETLSYVGGPLSKPCGETLVSNGVRICQFYGSTEAGGAPLLVPQPEDWEYMEFHPCFDIHMEPVLDGGVCELVFRTPSAPDTKRIEANQRFRGIDWTFPDAKEYHSKDLFAPHPRQAGLWKFCGRVDDIVALRNHKINALDVEVPVMQHPDVAGQVSGVMLVGNGRECPGLLVEPRDAKAEHAAVIDAVYPAAKMASAGLPAGAQVRRNMIRVVDARGFIRAGKGTVVRSMSEDKYAPLIDSMYAPDGLAANGKDGSPEH